MRRFSSLRMTLLIFAIFAGLSALATHLLGIYSPETFKDAISWVSSTVLLSVSAILAAIAAVEPVIGNFLEQERMEKRLIQEIRGKTALHLNESRYAHIRQIGQIGRQELGQLQEHLNASQDVLIVGEGGSGKTGLLSMFVSRLAESNLVLYLPAIRLPRTLDTLDQLVSHWFNSDQDLIEILDKKAKKKKHTSYLIIDEIDQLFREDNLWRVLRSLVDSANLNDRIRTIVVVRSVPSDEHLLTELEELQFQQISLPTLTNLQAENYLEILGCSQPHPKLIDLATNLRNLSLVSELGSEMIRECENIMSEPQLWDRYMTALQHKEEIEGSNQIFRKATELAETMLQTGQLEIALENCFEVNRLVSWGACVRDNFDRGWFRYDDLVYYLYGREVFRHRVSLDVIRDEVDSRHWLKTFDAILNLALAYGGDNYFIEFAGEIRDA